MRNRKAQPNHGCAFVIFLNDYGIFSVMTSDGGPVSPS
jgi:hypothetical protein